MINSQLSNRNIEHQIMLIEQSDLCPTVTNIYDEIYQGLIFNALTYIQSCDRMGECPRLKYNRLRLQPHRVNAQV